MENKRTFLDPNFPEIWEDPVTLRIGADRALARVRNPSAAAQRLIGRLRQGIAAHTFAEVASHVGCSPAERDQLQFALTPVIRTRMGEISTPSQGGWHQATQRIPDETAPTFHSVAVVGRTPFRTRITSDLSSLGYRVHPHTSLTQLRRTPETSPDLVIAFEQFWAPPRFFQELVMLGQPHLSIRFSDQSLTIGSVMFPSRTACGVCVQLHDTKRVPELPVVASQLLGSTPHTATEAHARFAVAIAHQVISTTRAEAVEHIRYRFDITEKMIQLRPHTDRMLPHPECGCALTLDSLDTPEEP